MSAAVVRPPRWRMDPTDGPQAQRSGRCEAFRESSGEPVCGDPATKVVTIGCVHEHVGTRPGCDKHAADIETRAQQSVCRPCWRADEHHCPIAVTVDPAPTGDVA